MRFLYNGNDHKILLAIQSANSILKDEGFCGYLTNKSLLGQTKNTETIVRYIKYSTIEANIETYASLPLPPWNRIEAYTLPLHPDIIFINDRVLQKREVKDIAATLIQKYIQIVDFNVNSNSNRDKSGQDFVFKRINRLARKLLSGNNQKVFQDDYTPIV